MTADNLPAERDEAEIEKVNLEIHEGYTRLADLVNSAIPAVVEAHGDNKDVMLHTLKLHQDLLKAMKLVEELISEKIIEHQMVPYGGEPIEGIGFVEIHRTGAKVRTDNPMIASQVKKKLTVELAVDHDTGEVNERASKAVAATVDEMVKLTGANTESFNGWRKRVAKALDIDITKYETKEGGRLKVTIK